MALLAMPASLLARTWPQKALAATDASKALINLLGTDQTTPSEKIALSAPAIAENGAAVAVSVECSLPGIESISIVVEKNPRPLAISFDFTPRMLPGIACRIKMAETSRVMAVVATDHGIFSTSREVKVTVGGCA